MTLVKLDENLGASALLRVRAAGHDAESVRTEDLNGAPDVTVFDRCVSEGRALITLDLDFADPIRFPPAGTAGTIILRARRPSAAEIDVLLDEAMERLRSDSVQGCIWIVEPGRVRIYTSDGM